MSDQRILGDEAFRKEVFRRRRDEASESAGMPTVHFELDELEEIMQSAMGFEPDSLRSGGAIQHMDSSDFLLHRTHIWLS